MIRNKEDLRQYLKQDSMANIGKTTCGWFAMKMNLWYGNDSYRFLNYLIALRKYEYALNCLHGSIGKIRVLYAKFKWHSLGAKYNVNIYPNVAGPGIKCRHLVGGIVLNCKSIGKNCMINTGVLIGNKGQDNLATIGDNVFLAAGCKVIGKVSVGDNVIVAPNSVVIKDVPANTIVSGVPATVLRTITK